MPPKFKREYGSSREPEKQALLDGNSDDDDFFLNGPSARPDRLVAGQRGIPDPRMSRLQNQVEEVVDVMQDNIGKVMDRGERLEDLQDKSDSLSTSADMFRVRAKGLKNQMWWKECKMRMLLAAVILIILVIIIVPIIMKYKSG